MNSIMPKEFESGRTPTTMNAKTTDRKRTHCVTDSTDDEPSHAKATRQTNMAPEQGLAAGAEIDTDSPDSDSGEQSDDPSMQDRRDRQLSSRLGRGRTYITGVSGGAVKNSTVVGNVIDSSVNVHNPKSVYIKSQAPSLAMQVLIRQRTEEFLSIWTNGMIRTKATEILIDKIGKGARWITITGCPGDGKSTLGYLVLQHHLNMGRPVYEVRSPEEYKAVSDSSQSVIMIDDVFGQYSFNKSHFKWESVVTDICKLPEHKGKHSNRNASETSCFILTSRTDVLTAATHHFNKFSKLLLNDECRVDLAQMTTSTVPEEFISERVQIWESHARRNEILVDKDTVVKVCSRNSSHGFPQCCKLYANEYYTEVTMTDFFLNPIPFLNETMESLMGNKTVGYIVRQMLKNDGSFDLASIEDEERYFELYDTCQPLKGTYLSMDGSEISFQHSSIYESAAFVVCGQHPKFVIENCSMTFLNERVRFEHLQHDVSDICMTRNIKREFVTPLIQRLQREVNALNIQFALSHESFHDNEFVVEFMEAMASTPVRTLLTLIDKVTQHSFLFFSTSSKSAKLLKHICGETELSSDQQEDCIFGICKHSSELSMSFLLGLYKGTAINCQNAYLQTPLMVAASKASGEMLVSILLENGADVNIRDEYGYTALEHACDGGNTNTLVRILKNGADINTRDNEGQTPLHTQCTFGKFSLVSCLMEHGADMNISNKKGKIPLHDACIEGFKDIVNFLLHKGAHVNANDHQGMTPLHYSCEYKTNDIVRVLLASGADVNIRDNQGYTPLRHSCDSKNIQPLFELLGKGADINTRDTNGRTPLQVHCSIGEVSVVTYLLKQGADINIADKNGQMPLHGACIEGFKDIVALLLEKGEIINKKDSKDKTPLHYSCEYNRPDTVGLLLDNGSDLHAEDKKGYTPLRYACYKNKSQCATHLLENGADINAKDAEGRTALQSNCAIGEVSVVTYLLEQGADINIADKNGQMPIHEACREGFKDIVALLLSKDADVNTKNKKGKTPLHYSCGNKENDIMGMLLEVGADVHTRDKKGFTPLRYACYSKDINAVTHLLEKGADINTSDTEGQTPLNDLCSIGEVSVVTYLLEQGADINIADKNGQMPIHEACREGFKDIVALLLSKDADVNTKNKKGKTPLHYSCGNKENDIMGMLLEVGADVHTRDKKGFTPLRYACYSKDINAVTHLLEKGADINTSDTEGQTPLNDLCSIGEVSLVTYLLEQGADINIADKNGQMPIHGACREGFKDIVALLLNKGADVNTKDKKGKKPLYYSCDEVINRLLNKGANTKT